MRCRVCGCSSPPSPSTVVRPRPNRGGEEASACVAGSSFPSPMLGQTCCVSARASSKRFKCSRAVSRCWVETRLTSLSVRPWCARMVTSCWAPVTEQYYATTTETRDLDTMGLEMKARGRKRLCSVNAENPSMHSCGGLPPRVVW